MDFILHFGKGSRRGSRIILAVIAPVLLAWFSQAAVSAEGAEKKLTREDCPLCRVAGMVLTGHRGTGRTLTCLFGSQDPAEMGAKVEYSPYSPPAVSPGLERYRGTRRVTGCIMNLSGRMQCGDSFIMAGKYKVKVEVYLPWPRNLSKPQSDALKRRGQALLQELLACVKAAGPPGSGAPRQPGVKLEGRIVGYDYCIQRMRLSLAYGGSTEDGATDGEGRFTFAQEIPAGEECELTLHFESMRDGLPVYRLLFRNNPETVRLVLRVRDGRVTGAEINLGGTMRGRMPSAGQSLKELQLQELFHSDNPMVSFVSIYLHLSEALAFYTRGLGEKLNFQLPLEVAVSSDRPTRYHYPEGKSRIDIHADASHHTDPSRPVHREYHEFSHYVMHALYGGKWPAPVDPAVPEINHGGNANPSTSDSYVEGFAIFMSILMHRELGDTIPHPTESLKQLYSKDRKEWLRELETDYKAWDREGKAEELAVAGVLWDLFDGREDNLQNAELIELTYDLLLKNCDVNGNGSLERAELLGMLLMSRFATSFDEDEGRMRLNEENLTDMARHLGISREGFPGTLGRGLLSLYDRDGDGFLAMGELSNLATEKGEGIWPRIDFRQYAGLTPDNNTPVRVTRENYRSMSAPGDDDNVQLPFEEMWSILRGYHQNFFSVFRALIRRYPGRKGPIEDVFKAHGFFADVAPQNRKWDKGEEIGRAADAGAEWRRARAGLQPLPGQFVRVDNRVPYYHVTVLFPMRPHLSYSTRKRNDNGRIPVPIPPREYVAFIHVAPEGVRVRNPLAFPAGLFHARSAEALKRGYILKHHFRLEGDIPKLPAFPAAGGGVQPAGKSPESAAGGMAVAGKKPVVAAGTPKAPAAFDWSASSPPRLIHQEPVIYPRAARAAGIEGIVTVRVLVNTGGRVREARVTESPHGVLSEAAIRAVSGYRYEPMAINGEPREFSMTLMFTFSRQRNGAKVMSLTYRTL